ncbi:hypothetical protein [Pseudomonas izuensis]|uniref:Uncharacterized protein n=1 Tax=Pseudomonas izuensis TaxID=2684212 RepID=A0ABM7RU53_9PSED|nr:hypothetical protein [Pseudomonas izuensis]BCX68057.1 hypothetical protein LAB08_R26970 [Pseudomonas izuensis]
MAGNTVESLLAWMKDASQMHDWDLIVALSGQTINRELRNDHIRRLSQGSDLGDIGVSIPIPQTNITQILSGVKLDAPATTYENASLQSSKTGLSQNVVGGTLMMVETVQGQKRIIRLSTMDPLDGAKLRMHVPVRTDSSRAWVDLAEGEEPFLTLFHTELQQQEAGKHFLERFKELSADKRILPLSQFTEDANPFMQSRSIDVRSQKRATRVPAAQALNEEGELLLFTSMVQGRKGGYPKDEDFRNLIPDDDEQRSWSGTALFSRALIHRAAFGDAVLKALPHVQFERLTDEFGTLTKMVAKSGALHAPDASYRSLEHEFESDAFELQAKGGASPLTIEFFEHQVKQRWPADLLLSFKYRPVGGTTWQPHTATFRILLDHEFHFSADDAEDQGMLGELWVPYESTQEVRHVSGLPGTIDPKLLEHIEAFVAQTVKRALLESFSNTLTATSSRDALAELDIVGQSYLHPIVEALPLDHAKFCVGRTSDSSFSIVQPQSLVAAGKTLQLGIEPPRAVKWAVENFSGSGSDPGSIDDHGLYKAPPRHAIQGTYNRVLITATDEDTSERSVSLVTVQSDPVTVNPRIQTCFHSERVELSAGGIGGEPLEWSIKNPVPGQSGTLVDSNLPESDRTYVAAPKVANQTYVLDQIEAKNSQTGEVGSAWVLVMQHEPGATIKPVLDPGQPEGQIQLQAFVNSRPVPAKWSVAINGPGEIDSSGVYYEDPLAKEHFVLVMAEYDDPILGQFLGHLILPIPLKNFPTVLKSLAE